MQKILRTFTILNIIILTCSCNNQPGSSPFAAVENTRTKIESGTDYACPTLALNNMGLSLVAEDIPFIENAKKYIKEKLPSEIRDTIEIIPTLEDYSDKPQRIPFKFAIKNKDEEILICNHYAQAFEINNSITITGRYIKDPFDINQIPDSWPDEDKSLQLIANSLNLPLTDEDISAILSNDGQTTKIKKCFFLENKKLVPALHIDFTFNHKEYWGESTNSILIKAEKSFFEVEGHMQVFSEGQIGNSKGLETIRIKDISPGGSLCSSRFVTEFSDGKTRAFSTAHRFIYSPNDHRFEETAVFGNASRMSNWFLSLIGDDNWPGQRITLHFDENNNGINNTAVYLPAKEDRGPTIKLGKGDDKELRNLRVDPDVISHELSHHFVYRTLKSTSGESVVIHEGLADFFVFSRTGNACLGEAICPKSSSICLSSKCLRAGDTTLKWDDPNLPSEAHKKSQVLSGLLWDLHATYSQINVPRLVFKAIDFLNAESTLKDFLEALFLADQSENGGSNVCKFYEAALKRGFKTYLDGVDCNSYKN